MPRGKPNPKVKITKARLEAWKATNPRGERHYDSALPGFGVTVYPTGRRAFSIEYRVGKKRRRAKVGIWGPYNVNTARTKAKEMLASVAMGQDPLAERQAAREAMTFVAQVARYMEEITRTKRPGSVAGDKIYLGRTCERWADIPLRELTSDNVRRLFEAEIERGHVGCNRWLASVRACLSAAWREGLIAENVALRIRPLPQPPPRARVLSDEELVRLAEAVEQLPDPHVRAAYYMLMHTGCRKSEALGATWEDFDLTDPSRATWRIPRPKSGRPEVKMVTQALAEMLVSLPRTSRFVIAGKSPMKPRTDLKRSWEKIRREADLPDVTVHDIRRTYGLEVARTAGLHVASKLLGHSTVRVTERVYAPLQERELREAAEKVHRIREAKILPFRRAGGDEQGE